MHALSRCAQVLEELAEAVAIEVRTCPLVHVRS